jgi:processive 1,2-diacylglycerol beta-glucosyltransferase
MKVLITYASAGAGHRRAAEAIYDYLISNRKDIEAELVDILTFTNPFFRFCYNYGYPFLVHYARWLWGFFFRVSEFSLTRKLSRRCAILVNYLSCRKFLSFLIRKKFDFIISTHFLNSELAATLKLKNRIKSKLITVITDFGVHPFWISCGTDLYVVASELTKDKLLNIGVSEQQIRVFGIPFSPNFAKVQNRMQLAAKFGIDGNKFTVLIMTGSFGSGPLEKITENLYKEAQILVVCAENKRLFKSLSKKSLKNVQVFAFVNNTEELMGLSDVIITKPGGLSIAELLNMELLPIFISAIPGQEEENIKALSAYGLGFLPTDIRQIRELVLELRDNPQKLQSLKRNIANIAKPFACQEIASVIR